MKALPVASTKDVRRYAVTLMRRHPGQLTLALALHALAAVAGLGMPFLIGKLVQSIKDGTTTATVDKVALAIVAFVLVQTVLVRFAKLASATLGERVLAELREDFVDRTLEIPLSTVERAGTGDLLTRTSRDVDALSHSVRLALPEILIAIVTTLFTVGILAFLVVPYPRAPFVVPLLWCLVGSQASFLLGVPQDLGLIAAAVVGIALMALSTGPAARVAASS